jgi:hypothetical protein
MQEFAAVLGNAVTGLFTLLGAFLVWRLKRKEDEGERKAAIAVAKRAELVELFAQVFTSLEQAMKCAIDQTPFDLTAEGSLVNAKLRLLASERVNLAYDDVSDKLQSWSSLHAAALPRKRTIGDQTFVVLQAPNPTENYKGPAEDAHKLLHEALQVLRKRMREDLGET